MKTTILTLLLIPTLTFASIDKDLKFGMTDIEVAEMQEFLINNGYSTLKTGYFGAKTLQAVKKYQTDNEIPSTGFVGRLTRASMNSTKPVLAETTAKPIEIIESTTTEATTKLETFKETIATTTLKEYNILMDTPEIIEPTIVLGTPTYEYLRLAQVYEGFIPVTVSDNTVKNGGTLTIDGTVPEEGKEDASYRVGTVINKTTPKPYAIEVHQVRGDYKYTITLKDSNGEVVYTKSDTLLIPKHESENK